MVPILNNKLNVVYYVHAFNLIFLKLTLGKNCVYEGGNGVDVHGVCKSYFENCRVIPTKVERILETSFIRKTGNKCFPVLYVREIEVKKYSFLLSLST